MEVPRRKSSSEMKMTSEVDLPNRSLRNNINTQNVEGDAHITIVEGGY